MKLTNMHLFLIICFAAISAIVIILVVHIWACSLAAFLSIIALTYMFNDYLEDREKKHPKTKHEPHELIEEGYPDWVQKEKPEGEMVRFEEVDLQLVRKRMISRYMSAFKIDEVRAANLYDEGYRSFSDIQEATLKDLIKVKGINPTLARRIQIESERF